MSRAAELRVGIIGCGHQGTRHIHAFAECQRTLVVAIADQNRARLERLRGPFAHLRAEVDHRRLLDNPAIDAVVVATPTSTHAAIALEALRAGKHVLVEEPLSLTTTQAESLAQIARANNRILMIGRMSLFNAGVNRMRDLITDGTLGKIQYLDALQTVPDTSHRDVSVLFDPGARDISVFNYVLGQSPVAVSAFCGVNSQPTTQDVCFVALQYEGGVFAHLQTSRLDTRRVRTVTAVGSERTATWDEFETREPFRLFEKSKLDSATQRPGAAPDGSSPGGDVYAPAIGNADPLLGEAEAFTRWILDGASCECGVREGMAVASVIEAANRSMSQGGALCAVGRSETGVVLKEARADAASIPTMPTPSIDEIERVRRRCIGETPVGAQVLR